MKGFLVFLIVIVLVIALIAPIELYFLGAIDTARYSYAEVYIASGKIIEGSIKGWQKISGSNQIMVRFTTGEIVRTDAENVILWVEQRVPKVHENLNHQTNQNGSRF